MRRLILLRHAEALPATQALRDYDRPLSEAGEQSVRRVARRLLERDLRPQLIVSSTAVRALDTAYLAAMGLDCSRRVHQAPQLYHASAGDLLAEVNGLDEACHTVMLVAHNPGLADLVGLLSQGERWDMPTCGAVGFEFDVAHWAEAAPHNSGIWFTEFPRR